MPLHISALVYWLFLLQNFCLISSNESYPFPQGKSVNNEMMKSISNVTDTADDGSNNDKFQVKDAENKFFIKYNTIIRTGESRALGAKYINETKLQSNHDCLTWCLETPSCNAAVYEEKNMQSCYMFDCGSPSNPQCKFTAHDYFTSSVLKISQHSYELSQWGKEIQLERGNTKQIADVSSSTTSVSPLHVTTVSSSPFSTKPSKKGNHCHHYQFQCVNSTECIAIYNVCDGIPQCPDGSDESIELKCPDTDTHTKVIPNMMNRVMETPPSAGKTLSIPKEGSPHLSVSYTGPVTNGYPHKKPEEPKETYRGAWPNSYSGPQLSKPVYRHRMDDSEGIRSPFVHKHSQFISANDPHVQNLNRWANDYDQYSLPHSTSVEQQYNPYDREDEPYISNQLPADYDTPKSYGGYRPDVPNWSPYQDVVQDSSYTADDFPQPGIPNLNKMMGYPAKDNPYAQQISRTVVEQYPETKISMHKPIENQNQSPDLDDYKLRRYPHSRPYLSMEESLQPHLSNYPEMKTKPLNPVPNVNDVIYNNNDDLIRASLVNQIPNAATHEHEFQPKARVWIHSTQETSITENTMQDDSLIIVKPTSHTKAIQKTVLDFKMSVAELYESSTTHSHEENSAIVALILGVTISFLLITLLACRIKTLRRRMSRKGRALAHDADYLVNGMYL